MPYLYKDVKTTKQVITGFECSKCKARFDAGDVVEMEESIHLRSVGGFGSVWGDGATYEISLCQSCSYGLFSEIATIHAA